MLHKAIKSVLNKNKQSTVLSNINKDGKVLTKDSDMLEALNHHFVSVGTQLAKTITTKPDDDCLKHVVAVNSKLILKTIDITYVLDAIGRQKIGKASGPDKVTINLVEVAARFIAYTIMSIINSSIANGVFPDVWKTASFPDVWKTAER